MIVEITEESGHVLAMGHRVPLERGGEAELKRRCLGTIAQLDHPPSLIEFLRCYSPELIPGRPAADLSALPIIHAHVPTLPAPGALPERAPARSHKRR